MMMESKTTLCLATSIYVYPQLDFNTLARVNNPEQTACNLLDVFYHKDSDYSMVDIFRQRL